LIRIKPSQTISSSSDPITIHRKDKFVQKSLRAAAREHLPVFSSSQSFSPMMTSSGNRYAALQDNDHEGSDEVFTTPDSADHVAKINTVVNDQEGWEDDIEIDQDDSEVFDDDRIGDDQDRCRKISPGLPFNSIQTFAFSSNKAVKRRGAGRGGGMTFPYSQSGGLLAIAEETLLEDEKPPVVPEQRQTATMNLTRNGKSNNDLSGLIESTVPPDLDPQVKKTTTFTFRAQLTWGLERGPEVNLPEKFREWVAATSKYVPNFALLPFEDVKGQVISTQEQVPYDNPTFYKEYYYNHRVLQHGNLTGMVQFQCSVSWQKIKRMKEPYFQWLHRSKVYLNLTKFKSDTLVVCGFLLGAHPGHLRREDAEKELVQRMNFAADFPFRSNSQREQSQSLLIITKMLRDTLSPR